MDPLERFTRLVASEDFGLAEAFLAFARAEYPALDEAPYLSRLDRFADEVRPEIGSDPAEALTRLGAHLSGHGLRGNTEAYHDPRNSYLNEVLDRGLGIPIALSVVWMEVGQRADLRVVGIGLPMHFLVGVEDRDVYADPFNGGRLLEGQDAVVSFFDEVTGGRFTWRDEYLAPVPEREIVRRALRNLKAVYGGTRRLEQALRTQEYVLAVPGWEPTELRDRAGFLAGLGRQPEAIADLRTYLATGPEDTEAVEREIRRLVASMN